MAIKQPLFEQNDTTDQSADIARLFIRDMLNERSGKIQESAFEVRQRGAGANNSVDVQPGGFVIPGTESGSQGYYYVVNDAVVNIPMSTGAHGSLPRIDSVLIDVRDSIYSGSFNDARITYQAGTAAASPVQPDLTALGYKNYYRLANISVPANDNTITTVEITDTRTTRASAVGGTITCTSSTRPSLPRPGQQIWEMDTSKLLVNRGTAASPNWLTTGTNIVAQQKVTASGSTFASSATSDFALNNVSVIAGHTYSVHLSSTITLATVNASTEWIIRLRVNGANTATFYDLQPVQTGTIQMTIDTTVFWVAPITQASDDLTVFCELAISGSTFQFYGSGTTPRWFTLMDMGVL